MKNKRLVLVAGAAVFAVALAVNLAVCVKSGMGAPMESDAEYFRGLAANLAAGKGYVLGEGLTFWPGEPTLRRLPGWPFVTSLVFRLFGTSDGVMRGLNAVINALVALLLFCLTLRLFKCHAPCDPATHGHWGRARGHNCTAAALAGLGYTVHPTALRLTSTGFSEPLFLLLAVGGVLFLIADSEDGRRGVGWRSAAGTLLFGLACLVRANYVLWLPWYAVLLVLAKRGSLLRDAGGRQIAVVALAIALFVLPSSMWMLRNRAVSGHFPVMSTIKGQTFYGGNNEVVATQAQFWGYWVFPNEIPDEHPMGGLAKNMSECEVDAYYMKKGKAFIRANLAAMPKLWLGKLIRAYVPVPWTRSIGTLVVSAFRWVLYLSAVIGFVVAGKKLSAVYGRCLAAMVLTSAVTVLVFWGCARFAFAVEPFLLPLCGVAAVGLWGKWRRRHP